MKNKLKNPFVNDMITYLMVIAAYVIVEMLLKAGQVSSLMKGLLVPLCTYSILAVSLNLVVGISGELSLGHAGFMCVGAFTSALWTNLMNGKIPPMASFILAILVGAACAALAGFLIGIPVLRLRGDYLAIVTLAFGEIIKNIVNALYLGVDSRGFHFSMKDNLALGLEKDGVTIIKGAQGITGTPKMSSFTAGVILLLLALFIVQNLIRSRTGRAIMAIRDNRIAAESVGVDVTKYKMTAFVISAAMAGAAGALFAQNYSTITANKFDFNTSILILVLVVLGGLGNITGSIISATLLTILPEALRSFATYRMLVYAIVLIVVMLFTNASGTKIMVDSLKAKFSRNKEEEEQ